VDFGVLIPTQAFGVHNGGFELEVIEDGLDSQAAIGDEVTLIGKDGNRAIIVDDVAGCSSTISHEILCGIFNRVPRSDTRQEARAE
jgi:alanine racemase